MSFPRILGMVLGVLIVTAGLEWRMGCLPLGPDGRFGWWEGEIWSRELSQRLVDPYSFTHISHGLLFCLALGSLFRHWSFERKFLAALLLEAFWEILENSPLIIDRYRTVTMALGYCGDSILNSLSDILMMALGFLLALRLGTRRTLGLVLAMEVILLLVIRDNLTLNLVMLIHPLEFIRNWQMTGVMIP